MPDIEPVDDEAPTATATNQDAALGQDSAGGSQAADDTPRSVSQDDDAPPRSIGKDDAFHLLQNARPRAVLRYLLAHPEQETFQMRDLAEEIAAWEHDTTVRHLASQQRQRVYIALYQSHLPKLNDHGVIRYYQSRGIVKPTSLTAVFAPFLEDGLDADTQHLALNDAIVDATTETGHRAGLVPIISSLFAR